MAISSLNNSQPIQNQTNPAFKGKYKKTEQGNLYYHTNSGTKVGTAIGGFAALYWLMAKLGAKVTNPDELKTFDKATKEEITENLKHIKSRAIPLAVVSAVCSVACGLFVDHMRNKKAQETSDLIRQVGLKQAINTNENIELSNRRKPYYRSNAGSKYGALLGLGCGIVNSALLYTKSSKSKLQYITSPLLFALGGWLAGKTADHYTNKDTQNNA